MTALVAIPKGAFSGMASACGDALAAHSQHSERGVEFTPGPKRQPWRGITSQFYDQDSNAFLLVQHQASQRIPCKGRQIPMKQTISRFSVVLAAMVFLAGAAAPQAQSPQKPALPAAQPTREEMEHAIVEAAKPGPIHAQLMKRAGTYTTSMTFTAPGSLPQESKGTATLKSILGGRFLEEKNSGDSFGQPSAGLRLYGYNNGSKQYEAIWIYDGSTAFLVLDGTSDDGGKTVRYTGAFLGPGGMKQTVRVAIEQKDPDHFVVRLIGEGPGGAGATLETVYTRTNAGAKK